MTHTPKNSATHTHRSRKDIFWIVSILALFSLLGLAAAAIPSLKKILRSPLSAIQKNSTSADSLEPQPQKYQLLIKQLKKEKARLAHLYQIAPSDKKKEVIKATRNLLEQKMPELMRCWIGTPWDFNGTSQTPGERKIACGYFVSVVLRDAGFCVSRISLAQQPSQRIITSIIHNCDKEIIRYKKNYASFIKDFKTASPGIYIIGLDTHVGFLTNLNGEIHFLHSGASGVIDQTPAHAKDIEFSKYRVIGNITAHDYVLEKWITGEEFTTNKG